jgi:hypothetical protein
MLHRIQLPMLRVVLLLILAAGTAGAQQHVRASNAAELTRLENQWTAGLVRRDSALFDRLLAPRFVYTEDDKLMQREDVLHDVATSTDTVRAARNEGMEVHQYSPTTAVVTGWLIVEGHGKAEAFTHRYRFTDTWLKGSRGWQIVAAQDYLVPAGR